MFGDIPLKVEFDTDRKLRTRNKLHYRFNHWPIWIFVFFIAPGPLTASMRERERQRLLQQLAQLQAEGSDAAVAAPTAAPGAAQPQQQGQQPGQGQGQDPYASWVAGAPPQRTTAAHCAAVSDSSTRER